VNTQDREDGKSPAESEAAPVASGAAAEDKRIAARRRFLKMGAGGSTAMLVTIMHQRAFAKEPKIKKGQIISACVSMQGVPDIKGMKQKKAIQLSPLGSPKHVMCRPKPATNQCAANNPSRFFNADKEHVLVVDGGTLDKGCGNLDDTLHYQRDFRLYEKGYCPVKVVNGDLMYDDTATYWAWVKENGDLRGNQDDPKPEDGDLFTELKCELPAIPIKK